MIKICFVGGQTSHELLKQLVVLTPGVSGKWGDLVGITDHLQADVIVILENPPYRLITLNKNIICFSLEPDIIRHAKGFPPSSIKCTLDKHPFVVHSLNFLNPKINYDELMKLEYTPKPKKLCIISSNLSLTPSHNARVDFIKKIIKDIPECDLYGFGWDTAIPNYRGPFGSDYRGSKINSRYKHKMDILRLYQYVIVIENSRQYNYFTEKITDVLLGWSFPLYCGAPNINTLLPPSSVIEIDINDYYDTLELIYQIINTPPSPTMIDAMRQARQDILNKYNIWEAISKQVKNIPSK